MALRITHLSVLFFLLLSCTYFITRDACLTPTTMIGYDASVFATFGGAWLDGLLPYKDLFDHKGPVIFFLSMLGFWLGGDFYGIVYIEIINLFLFSAIFLYINRDNSIIYYLFFLFIYWIFIAKNFEGGNLTEEYALLFNGISASAWLKRAHLRFFLYGLSGSMLVFMRMNLAALSLCIFLIDLWYSKSFCKYIFQTFLGFIIPSGFIILYFFHHDALYDFYQTYIVFNMHYIQGSIGSIIWTYLFLLWKNCIFFLICIAMLILIYIKKKAYFSISVIFIIVPFLLSCISGRAYSHYILSLAPSIFILFSLIFDTQHTDTKLLNILSYRVNERGKHTLILLYIFLIILSLFSTVFFYRQRFDTKNLQSLRASFRDVGLHPQARVLNLGNTMLSSIYYLSQTHPPVKEFFPLATMATPHMQQLLKNQHDICPAEKYDFLLLTETQRLSPSCPYVPVTTDFTRGKLYKYSPASSNVDRENHE